MTPNLAELDLAAVGDVSPPSVEDDFQIDLTETVYIPQVRPSYHRLQQSEVRAITDTLADRYDEAAVREIELLFRNMKKASYQPATSQTYEWLVRHSLDAPGQIRGDGDSVEELPDHAIDVFREHYRTTQAFLHREFSRTTPLYRGLYPEEYTPLVRAILDHPYQSAYLLSSPVVTSYTLSKDIADSFSDGVRIQWDLQDNAVAFAADCLRKPPTSLSPEGEMHVLSGSLLLSNERFIVTLSEEYSLTDLIRRMTTPSDLPVSMHQDLLDLLELLVEFEIQTNTRQATNRLWLWYRYCDREGVLSEKELELAKGIVTYISGKENWQPDREP